MTRDLLRLTPRGLQFGKYRFACSIGRAGLSGAKREGDGATPTGRLRLVGMFYRPDRLARPNDWAVPIGPRDLWSDDSADEAYNHWVRAPYAHSHERLRRADPLYDLIIATDWNWPKAAPGRGSAIFVHQWRRPGYPTEGCIALSRRALHFLARALRPGTPLIIAGLAGRACAEDR